MKNQKVGIVVGTGYAGMLSERLAKMHDITVVSPDIEQEGNLYDLKTKEPFIISEVQRYEHPYKSMMPSKHKCTRKKKPRKKNKKTHLKKRK